MEEIPVTIALDGYQLDKKITNFDFIIQAVEQPNILVQKNTVFFRN